MLVQGADSYALATGGAEGDRVLWQGSGGSAVDLTDEITNGKMGGLLEMRDGVVAECTLNLDAFARELVFSVNQQHSQGVGLSPASSAVGSYASHAPGEAMGTTPSGLSYGDKIRDGSFKLWLYDENGDAVVAGGTTLTIDADVTALYNPDPSSQDLVSAINGLDPNLSATLVAGRLQIDASNGYTFAFSDDTSNGLAALGINTFFKGTDAGSMGVHDQLTSHKDLINAALMASDGTFSAGDNRNALAVAGVKSSPLDIVQWSCDRSHGNQQGRLNSTLEDYYYAMVGALGIRSASITRERASCEGLLNQFTGIRDSISAVSLDEEMMNLIKYQQAYVAASKLIQTSSEMIDTLLELN